eukprot:5155029-Pleurochrysis_carterae.AAC.4
MPAANACQANRTALEMHGSLSQMPMEHLQTLADQIGLYLPQTPLLSVSNNAGNEWTTAVNARAMLALFARSFGAAL